MSFCCIMATWLPSSRLSQDPRWRLEVHPPHLSSKLWEGGMEVKEGSMNILSAESPSLQQSFQKSHMYPLCCSVAKSCPTLCDPMDCSTPGFPVLHYLPEMLKLMSIESVMPSNHLILCHSLLLLPSVFPVSGSFPTSQLFTAALTITGTK